MSSKKLASRKLAPSIFAACVAAIALPAAAQNVQLYGVADSGLAATNFDGQTTTAVRENKTARWGMRGAEKISDRLTALFQLESEVDFSTGQTDTKKGMFARQAWVGLKGDLGTVRIGQTKALFDGLADTIFIFGSDGIVGDLSKPTWRVNVAQARISNSVTYDLPVIAGLTVAGQYGFDEQASGGHSPWALTAKYSLRDLTLVAGYDRGLVLPDSKGITAAQPDAYVLGASYQFGRFKLAASYNHGDPKDVTRTQLSGYTVSSTLDAGGGKAKAAYARLNSELPLAKQTAKNRDISMVAIGYDYPLSKRTTLYAVGMYEGQGQVQTLGLKEGSTQGVQAGMTLIF